MPNSELHILMTEDLDVDVGPDEAWNAKEGELSAIFVNFLKRVGAPVAA